MCYFVTVYRFLLSPVSIVCCSVDGEYVPKADDAVTYRTISIPPCHEKLQAVHVVITNMTPGVTHERWDSPFIH